MQKDPLKGLEYGGHDQEKIGSDVGCLRSLNLALLANWMWRFKMEGTNLWLKCMNVWHNISGLDSKPIARLIDAVLCIF